MLPYAYKEGEVQAAEDFGLRTAAMNSSGYQRALPQGDIRVSAERLAKTLSSLESGASKGKDTRKSRLDRPTRWGAVSSPWSVGASSYDYSGIGRDGAAI